MKRDTILITLTVILLLFVGIVVWNDRNSAVLDRTLQYELTDDMKVVTVKKHGSVFSRSSYEARIRIDHDHPEDVIEMIGEAYEFGGAIFYPDEYEELARDLFTGVSVVPHPENGTAVWVMACKDDNMHEITHIVCSESPTEAYLYIYYNR